MANKTAPDRALNDEQAQQSKAGRWRRGKVPIYSTDARRINGELNPSKQSCSRRNTVRLNHRHISQVIRDDKKKRCLETLQSNNKVVSLLAKEALIRMESENDNKARTRTRKPRAKEEKIMADPLSESKIGSTSDPDLPDEWISIAAYYIWKNDGVPEGRDAYYWERAKTELRQLQKDGNLPTALDPLDEER